MVKNNKNTSNSKSNMGMILVIAGVVLLLLFGMKGSGTGGGGNGGNGNGGNGGVTPVEVQVKRVECNVLVRNPIPDDKFEVKSAICNTKVFDSCKAAGFSVGITSEERPLAFYDTDDVNIKFTIGSNTINKEISVSDGGLTGFGEREKATTIGPICAKLATNAGMITLIDPRNGKITDEFEVSF